MKIILLLAFLLITGCMQQQTLPEAGFSSSLGDKPIHYRVAPWKHNAKGAYTIIFDDYCFDEAHGIQDYAAPEADKRGIKIGFGVVAEACDTEEWAKARSMIANGHEIINHSYSHRCGSLQTPWCTEVWTDDEVTQEIDQAAAEIAQHTGVKPIFFIFPYDLHTPAKIEHLRNQGYIGTRAGQKQALNPPGFTDPFALNFDVKFPPESIDGQGFTLNEYIDAAIAKGELAFRAVHGVNDQSWGTTSLQELREHFDYIQVRNARYDLWTDTISAIIRYDQARANCLLHTGVADGVQWMKVTGNTATCPHHTELSFILQLPKNSRIMDEQETPVPLINNTYTLKAGSTYRVLVDKHALEGSMESKK